MGQKQQTLRGFRTSFPPRDIRKNLAACTRVCVLKNRKTVSYHKYSPNTDVEIVRAYGLRPRLWLPVNFDIFTCMLSFVFKFIIELKSILVAYIVSSTEQVLSLK